MKLLFVVSSLRVANGVATVIMNQYDSLIDAGYEIDFLQFVSFESPYVDRIKNNSGKIFTIKRNFFSLKKIYKVLKENCYDIVHINQMNFHTVYLTLIAKRLKVKNIVYHSHNTKIPGGIKRTILEKASNIVYSNCANRLIACSNAAGKDSFGKKEFIVLKNSIDVKKFEYNFSIRKEIRERQNISDNTFVVGTVCRFANQKNPLLMIDIVNEVIKLRPNTIFLWVGSPPSKDDPIIDEMNQRVEELNIKEKMLWVGSKSDVYKWYSAMDVFLMPSKWEGLGITYIEAQANSLPTYASSVVPIDTKITDLIKYISLDCLPSKWAEELCKNHIRNETSKKNNKQKFIDAGFDSENAKDDLTKIYNSFFENERK